MTSKEFDPFSIAWKSLGEAMEVVGPVARQADKHLEPILSDMRNRASDRLFRFAERKVRVIFRRR